MAEEWDVNASDANQTANQHTQSSTLGQQSFVQPQAPAGQPTTATWQQSYQQPMHQAGQATSKQDYWAQSSQQPTYAAHAQQSQAQTVKPAYTAQAQAPQTTQKKGGTGKTFFAGFAGALLACALAFGGMTLYNNMSAQGEAGADSSSPSAAVSPATTINVTSGDATLPEAVAAKALPSVVCIYVYTQQNYGYYGFSQSANPSSALTQSSLGSGVILTEDGYILTNYHVVEGSDALKVNIAGEEYEATLVGSDPSSDLAVVKVSGATGLVPADIGDSDNLTVGEFVMTIGAPFGLEQSVATGVVSATSRSQTMQNTSSSDPYSYIFGYGSSQSSLTLYPNLIQTDAAINPGNSGGALVDADGKLIGINTLITSYSGNYSGVGFAIPINYAKNIADQSIAGKTPTHAKMGVSLTTVTSSLAKRYNLPTSSGAYVSAVTSEGALASGMEVGDIIVSIDGEKVATSTDVTLDVREHNPGDTLTVTVNRGGKLVDLSLVLGSDEEDLAAQDSQREDTRDYLRGR